MPRIAKYTLYFDEIKRNNCLHPDLLIKVYYGLYSVTLYFLWLTVMGKCIQHFPITWTEDRSFNPSEKFLKITIAEVNPRTSCKNIFIEFKVLTVHALYIFQVINFIETG